MIITWHGYSCIKFTETTKDGDVVVLVDPFKEESGAKLPRSLSADVAISTKDASKHNNLSAVDDGGRSPFYIKTPGEFEVKDILITTFEVVEENEKGGKSINTVPLITLGEMHILHLGGISKPLPAEIVDAIGSVDILCVPVGGGDVLSPADAAKMVGTIEPRIIIPMYYKDSDSGEGLETVDAFLKSAGFVKTEAQPKFKIMKKDLPQEESLLVLLDNK